MTSIHSKRNFSLLTIGQFISVMGDRISTAVFISIAAFIVGSTETSFRSSLLVAFQIIPFFLFGYFFGYMADRVEKRKILIFADIGRALALIVLFFFHQSLWVLYAVVFSIGFFSSMFEPARKSILPFLVERSKLVFYNKFFASMEIVAMMIGLAIGAFALKFFSLKEAIIFDAATYIFSMSLLLFLDYQDNYEKIEVNKEGGKKRTELKKEWEELKQGWIYLKSHDNLKYVIINIIFFHFLGAAIFFTTATDFGTRFATSYEDVGSKVGLSLLFVALGALFSPLVKNFLKDMKESTLSIRVFLSGSFVLFLLFLITTFTKKYFYIVLGLFFFLGILAGLQYIRFLYLIHMNCDKKYMGRVVSVAEITWSFVIVIGILIGSFINEFLTFKYGFLACSIVFLCGAISFYFTKDKITW